MDLKAKILNLETEIKELKVTIDTLINNPSNIDNLKTSYTEFAQSAKVSMENLTKKLDTLFALYSDISSKVKKHDDLLTGF